MDWKEFLQPDLRKIMLTAILFIISSLYVTSDLQGLLGRGFPLTYYFWTELPLGPEFFPSFSLIALTINIIFWYLIACGIIFTYSKYKKK